MDKTEKEFQKIRLRNKQRHINKMFNLFGLTEDVLREQVKINKERAELDIPDEEHIHEEYVQ